ncbi:MAG: FtsX-like permease family protein, partial [Geodermatophilaceae bacterium]
RGVTISPFGVIRHRRIRPPRLLPAVAFIVGVLALASFTTITDILGSDSVALASAAFPIVVVLFLITSVGLVLGSAALSAAIGGFLAARAGRPAVPIAARRLAADPFAASRAFGAVLLTVLVGAAAQGVRVATLAGTDPDDPFYADTLDLVNLVIVVAVVVASLGLLVVAAEGILTRRRTLAALTAVGTPVGVLRRAVLAELLLPLVPTSLLAATAGVLAARGLFGTTLVRYEFSESGQPTQRLVSIPIPWAELGFLVAGTLAVTLLVSSMALLFLRSSTDPAEFRAAA